MSKFVTKKWIELNCLSGGQYSVKKTIRFKSPMLKSELCVYGDAYIVVKGTIDLLAGAANDVGVNVLYSKIMPDLNCAYQKLLTNS